MPIVYLQPAQFDDPPAPFRRGEAGHVWLGPRGEIETDTRVRLSANSCHALIGHGVVAALNALPVEGRVGEARDVLVPHATLVAVRDLFYEADRRTYGARFEFTVGREGATEFRVAVDNREYQRTLSRLQFLLGTASHAGRGVRLRI